MKKNLIAVCILLIQMTSTASAGMVISDHFDDGSLDSNWQVSFNNADAWTNTESGTLLTVTDINSLTHDNGSGGDWATVRLSQSFGLISDFQVGLGVSWDSENDNRAMQTVGVHLFDTNGDSVTSVLYNDAWVSFRGAQSASIANAGSSFNSGANSLAFSGNAEIDIVRTGGQIDVFWDSNNIYSGINSTEIAGVALEYEFYSFVASGPSFFGTESIDYITVEGDAVTAVPAPAAFWLLISGLIGLIGARKKSAKSTGNYA